MAINEELTIVVAATGLYRFLFESILVPSLLRAEPTTNQHRNIIPIFSNNEEEVYDLAGDTASVPYKELMLRRIQTYAKIVKQNYGQKILFLDCDILVTGPFKEELLSYLDEYDFAMQQNYIAGIWGVNCNQRSIDFFDRFVKLIESIPGPARPNGYPQFELCDFIDICAEEGTLSVLELPEKFGFLTKDTVIYHAINAGMALPAKAITLFFATCFLQQARANNFDILDDEEKEAFFKPRAHNTLNFHSGFKESDRELLNSHTLPNGGMDWESCTDEQICHHRLMEVLVEEPLLVSVAASWCPTPERTPRYSATLTKEEWNKWIENLKL